MLSAIMKKLTTAEFISKAKLIHGDKYDYSKVEYCDARTKVRIICPKHGEFLITPNAHLNLKQGCRECYNSKKRVGIIGIGKMDLAINKKDKIENKEYCLWKNLICRVYDYNNRKEYSTYKECSICEEWLTFSVFRKWIRDPQNGYCNGYNLDKDILIKGNKHYSPDTCCFVPKEINVLFTKRQNYRGKYPIGVTSDKKGYISSFSTLKGKKYLGYYKTPLDAFNAYKNAKEKYIKELAEKYFQEGKITKKVYDALMKYEVEITD